MLEIPSYYLTAYWFSLLKSLITMSVVTNKETNKITMYIDDVSVVYLIVTDLS